MLEYPSVTETRLDGSKTVHTFTSWTERPDEMTDIYTRMHRLSDGPGSNMIDTVSDIVNLRYVNRILEPRSSLQHFRGLPLKTAEYASVSSSPLQTVTLSYDLSEPEYRSAFTNVGEAYARVRRYAGMARAMSRTTSTYYDQDSVTSVTCYTYNSRGQVIDERSRTSDGDSLRTTRTFPQDYPSDTTLAAMTDRNFVSYPVTEVQLRRRSGSSSWDTTAAVRYFYAFHANLLDSAFYAVSEVRRWESVGIWVTESTYLYDNAGNIIQQTDADDISTSYVWNCEHGVSIIIENATRQQVESCLAQSPAVDITNTAAAAARLRSGLTQARVTDFDYQRYGLPKRMTNPAGHTFWYTYDDNDRLITVREDDAGILQQYHYNTVTR
jgi:YD repeat-containing protein